MDTTEGLHFHFSFSCIGERTGNPLQCSCLENPRDREPGGLSSMGSQSWTRLKRLSSSSSSKSLPESHLLPSIPLVKKSCMTKSSVSVGYNYLSCGCWMGKHLWLLLQSDCSSSSWPLRSLPYQSPIRLIFISILLLFYCPPPGTLLLPITGQRPGPLSKSMSYLSLLSKLDGILNYTAQLIQTFRLIVTYTRVVYIRSDISKGFWLWLAHLCIPVTFSK